MQQARNNLKTSSIIVMILAGLSLLNFLFELFFGELSREINGAAIPDGSPDNIRMIARIFVLGISLLILLPQFYIGIKGLKIAKEPNASKGHIIWGTILFVVAVAELLSPLLTLVQGNGGAFESFAELCSMAVDAFILFEYVKYAKAVRNEL